MKNSQYSLAFTAGASLVAETLAIATLKSKLIEWPIVRTEVIDKNILQARTQSTLKRVYAEISRRLKQLSDEELELLITTDEQEQRQLIWLAICRHYKLINEFTIEVVNDCFERGKYKISAEDYIAFFNGKAEWNSNLERASRLTKNKARQVLFRMMRECRILSEEKEILPQHLSEQLKTLIFSHDPEQINLFPAAEAT